MKRLNLEDFKRKEELRNNQQKTELLLSQVLGDCHDQPNSGSSSGGAGTGSSTSYYIDADS